MGEKFVYFNTLADITAAEIAGHIKTTGYTPITGGDGVDLTSEESVTNFLKPYKDNLTGAVLANPPEDLMRGCMISIENATDGMWEKSRDMFAVPMFNITQVVGRILSHNKKGSIIYLNSIHADKPIGGGFLYTIGCAAVQILCREAAMVYGGNNVGCYNIMRGIVGGEETRFTSDFSPIYHSGEFRFPKERLPSADSLNELCALLLSGGAYILNGADLCADEGFRLYYGKSWYYNQNK